MKRILYIEDHEDTAEAVRQLLTDAGYETEIALSGKDGIKKAKLGNYDIIILDIMLPDMSGWDIFKTLSKENLKCKYMFISVIPISKERMKELKKAGISDYITKPFEPKDLVDRVSKVAGD